MKEKTRPTQAPGQLVVGSGEDEVTFVLSPAHLALHGVDAADAPEGAALALPDEHIFVVSTDDPVAFPANVTRGGARAGAARQARPSSVGPVYTTEGGASLAVPTGRVFLRLAPGLSPQALHDAITQAGFAIEEIPVYAPHAVWLIPSRGDIAGALAALATLRGLPGAESATPELLMRRSMR